MRARVERILGFMAVGLLACSKAKSPNATEPECAEYRMKLFSFTPTEEKEAMGKLGFDKPSPLELKLCMERITSEEVRCAVGAATLEQVLACKPSVDIRPADAKRTPEECQAYGDHAMALAIENESGGAMGPPFTPAMAALFKHECERWLSKKRFDCVMKAPSPMGMMGCPP